MKKLITLATIIALSTATLAEAKHGGGFRISRPSTALSQPTKPMNTQRADATFNNTPPAQNSAMQNASGQRMANFATGAAAGYLLGEMLTPPPAQAQTNSVSEQAQAVENLSPATFKSFDSNNPTVIGKAGEQYLHCLNGAIYLLAQNAQPAALLDANGIAVQCKLTK